MQTTLISIYLETETLKIPSANTRFKGIEKTHAALFGLTLLMMH